MATDEERAKHVVKTELKAITDQNESERNDNTNKKNEANNAACKENEKAEEQEREELDMKPWEQHSSVISIPRYDYNAPSSLLHHSLSGFLITCPIKREKSATKEAISILEKYVNSNSLETRGSSEAESEHKRQRICLDEKADKCANGLKGQSIINNSEDHGTLQNEDMPSSQPNTGLKTASVLSLVKLTRSGLLLFTFPRDTSSDTVNAVSTIFQSLQNGNMKSPLWCHRIFPIQATCALNEKNLRDVVSKLVTQFLTEERAQRAPSLKFAIGYNRRGIEETEMKKLYNASNGSDLYAMLDRNKCFAVVAGAVKGVVPDAVVDLKSPDLSVLVEVLPLSRVPNGSLVVAVSVLPEHLIATKPRLCIKALVPDRKGKN